MLQWLKIHRCTEIILSKEIINSLLRDHGIIVTEITKQLYFISSVNFHRSMHVNTH